MGSGGGVTLLFTGMPSPVGDLLLAGDGHELSAVWIDGQRWAPAIGADWRPAAEPFAQARRQLEEYFAGERTRFDLPLRLAGTPFQTEVWRALARIPFAETRTYESVAVSLGRPTAARAVGAANGQNPLCIVVPCHRLIGSDGGLVDYAAGVDVKGRLLEHEARVAAGYDPAHPRSPARDSAPLTR
jgi:methylated-DNA-[protein]-cysteine S-methyltransferase